MAQDTVGKFCEQSWVLKYMQDEVFVFKNDEILSASN